MEKRLRTFTNVSKKNRKTLGVRWLKRHGVTAPLDIITKFSGNHPMAVKFENGYIEVRGW